MNATLISIAIISYLLITSFVLLIFRAMRDRGINEAEHYMDKKPDSRPMQLYKAS